MDRIELLKGVPIFSRLDKESLQRIADVSIERSYEKGEVIILQDTRVDGLYIVVNGSVRISRLSEDGRVKVLAILSAGDIIGEMSILDEELASATAEALEDSRLLFIKREDFQGILLKYPIITLSIAQILVKRLRLADEEIENLAFYSVRSRVIKTLIELVNRYGEKTSRGLKISFKFTHQELADMVGSSRETVSRIISTLEKEQLITNEGGYTIVKDIERLKAHLF
ncbi:Crp/Fnr family transcriptional regulator [bacterium]|nr:Crp/Fnr family transcriptional regulator [bacterium]